MLDIIIAATNKPDLIIVVRHFNSLDIPIKRLMVVDYDSQNPSISKSTLSTLNLNFELVYIHVDNKDYFNKSEAINIAAQYAKANHLLITDADVLLPNDFFATSNRHIQNSAQASYFSPGLIKESQQPNTIRRGPGICLLKTQDFFAVNGYCSDYKGWGMEDVDFLDRIQAQGLKEQLISHGLHLSHDDVERSRNYHSQSVSHMRATNRNLYNLKKENGQMQGTYTKDIAINTNLDVTSYSASQVSLSDVSGYEEIRIENTNHCGYKCFFCPRDAMTRTKGYMSVDDFSLLLSKFGDYQGSVDLHGFGEPLLDRDLIEKLSILKNKWPQCTSRIISTLGVNLSEQQLLDIAQSDLDVLEVSFYGVDEQSYKQAHGANKFERVKANLEKLLAFKAEYNTKIKVVIRDFPTHDEVEQPGLEKSKKDSLFAWFSQIGIEVIRLNRLHNYGGGRSYNEINTNEVCSITWGFRKRVLQVTWDLNIIPCCFDSNSEIVLGNLKEQSLAEIFASPTYKTFIAAHTNNDLSQYPVCDNCERCFKK